MSNIRLCGRPDTNRLLDINVPVKHTADISLCLQVFDLSTSKWGHGSPVSWASFLPIFSFPCPSVPELDSSTGQTDRTAISTLCPTLGWAHNNAVVTTTIQLRFNCKSTALRPFDDLRYERRLMCGSLNWSRYK